MRQTSHRLATALLVGSLLAGGAVQASASPADQFARLGAAGADAVELPHGFCRLPVKGEKQLRTLPPEALTLFTELEPNNTQATGNFLTLGLKCGQDNAFEVSGSLTGGDTDFFTFDLDFGDVVSANLTGAGSGVTLRSATGAQLLRSTTNLTFIYPGASQLPTNGQRVLSWVVDTAGTYAVEVAGGTGAYTLELSVFRPVLESQPEGIGQILFVDFDGATVNGQIFDPSGNNPAVLSPLSSFLANWGLGPADENDVIDAILATIIENLDDPRLVGNNGDYPASGVGGDYDVQVLNSRDHADPFGQPNVTRLIIGGTIAQLGIPTIGIAQSIDVGNFAPEESAVVLLDVLSAASGGASLNSIPLTGGSTIIDLIGVGVGNIAIHEAGHVSGSWHTEPFNATPNLMDSGAGGIANIIGLGPDATFGSSDDLDVDFGDDGYSVGGFAGTEDTMNVTAFGLSTGLEPETSFEQSACVGVNFMLNTLGLPAANCGEYCASLGGTCSESCVTNRGFPNWGVEAWTNTSQCIADTQSGGQVRCNTNLANFPGPGELKYRCCCRFPQFENNTCVGSDYLLNDLGLPTATCNDYCSSIGKSCSENCDTNRGLQNWGVEAWTTTQNCQAYATSGGQVRCNTDLSTFSNPQMRKYRCCCQ